MAARGRGRGWRRTAPRLPLGARRQLAVCPENLAREDKPVLQSPAGLAPVFVAGSSKLLQMQLVAVAQGSRGCAPDAFCQAPPGEALGCARARFSPRFCWVLP